MEHQHTSFQFFFKLIITSLLCIISSNSFAFASSLNCTATRTFIQTECNTTRFPGVCFKALAPLACKIKPGDQVELCRAALLKSNDVTHNALNTLLSIQQEPCVQANVTEAGVVADCVNTYLTLIRYTFQASQIMNTMVIDKATLPNLKLQISGFMNNVVPSESNCWKTVDGHVEDDLKKKIYAVVVYSLKFHKIIPTLANRMHLS